MTKRRSIIYFTMACMVAWAAYGGLSKPEMSLTLIPPSPVTDQITLDIRGAVRNNGDTAETFDVAVYLDEEKDGTRLYQGKLDVAPKAAAGFKFRWPTKGQAGEHRVLLVATADGKTRRADRPMEIRSTGVRSTKLVDGAWCSFNLPEMREGKIYDPVLAKMTNDQWREMVRGMHEVGMDIIIMQESVHNHRHNYDGGDHYKADDFSAKSFYPSAIFKNRMPMAADDPIEAIFDEADKLGMCVFPGVGLFAWFDFTPASLEWHKKVADELWDRYGHHPSFYGWYVSEEIAGNLGQNDRSRKDIVSFFKGFKEHVNRYTPDKPIMLAPNSHVVKQSDGYYPKLLEHLDILCPFGFHRMPPRDYSGEEVAKVLQKYCDDAGAHLWMDMEIFLFRGDGALVPRPIGGLLSDLHRFPNFERIVCFQYAGLMNAPDASIKPGGEPTVKLYENYLKYYKEGPPKPLIHAGRNKPVTLGSPAHKRYPGEGTSGLVDGVLGHSGDLHKGWLGFNGDDLTATVDLGASTDIYELAAHFMQQTGAGIYLPAQVEFAASDDGKIFRNIATLKPRAAESTPHSLTVKADKLSAKARYIRVTAKNIGTIPAGHSAAGAKAWLFCDEIMVNPEAAKAARK